MGIGKRIKSYLTVSPYGYFVTIYSSILGAIFVNGATQDPNPEYIIPSIISGLGVACGIIISSWHISSYRKLRDSMEETGYDEKRAEKFMKTLCDMNVLRTAASETGNLEKFISQCKK